MHAPHDIYDYEIVDANGRRLGQLTGFWVDDNTNQPEFASVKTGWLLGKEHLIPISAGQIDHAARSIRVPYEERLIRGAPGFAPDHHLSEDEEQRIYDHYALRGRYPRGSLGSWGRSATDRRAAGTTTSGREAVIPLHEENVHVGKRTVEEGVVRLRKVVRSEVKEVPVDLRRERVDIERIPARELRGRGDLATSDDAFREREITMTERREEPVVDKSRDLVGAVRATKEVDTRRETVRAELRREDVEVDRDAETDADADVDRR